MYKRYIDAQFEQLLTLISRLNSIYVEEVQTSPKERW